MTGAAGPGSRPFPSPRPAALPGVPEPPAMLYLIGLGLGDAEDITVKGLEAVRRCGRVYLEAYTSLLPAGREALVGGRGGRGGGNGTQNPRTS